MPKIFPCETQREPSDVVLEEIHSKPQTWARYLKRERTKHAVELAR